VTGRPPVKCVVWDLDRTLLDGIWLEQDEAAPPVAVPGMLAAAVELEGRGVLNAVASRNPAEAWPALATALAPVTFAAVELGWDAKSRSLARIAERLGIGVDALAFVDDDPYERAEVGFALPEVLVLSPEQLAEALDSAELSPPVVTAEAARRAASYRAREERRRAAESSGRPVAEFLAEVGTEITVRPAQDADAERLHELSVRTHRFNSSGEVLPAPGWRQRLADDRYRVLVVRLRDRFGDDGLVGGCLLDTSAPGRDTTGAAPDGRAWTVDLLMMSCRAMGRGVIERQLAAVLEAAALGGAELVRLPCRLTDRNVPLRLALRSAGFVVAGDPGPGGVSLFTHLVPVVGPTGGTPPAGPDPAPVGQSGPPGTETRDLFVAELAGLLAELTARPELASLGPQAGLLGGEAGLDSLRGTLLLAAVRQRYGVDVADLDVNLDALADLGTLARFVQSHRAG
jgi:methoxymalonate biosynthesis protein